MEPVLFNSLRASVRAVSQVGEVRVDAVSPSIPEGLHLLWFYGDVIGVDIFDSLAGC